MYGGEYYMKALSSALLTVTIIIGGCTARNVTTFILATPCEAALAGSGNICRELLETMIELSTIYPPDTHESDEQIGPDYNGDPTNCIVTESGYTVCRPKQIGGVVKPSVRQNFG